MISWEIENGVVLNKYTPPVSCSSDEEVDTPISDDFLRANIPNNSLQKSTPKWVGFSWVSMNNGANRTELM